MLSHRSQIVYQIQKRVGIAVAVVCSVLVVVNVYGGFAKGLRPVQILVNPAVFVLALCAIMAYFSAIRDSALLRASQAAVFLAYSYVASIALYPGSLHGALFGVYGVVLAIQYGLLRRYFKQKIAIVLGSYLLINIFTARSEDEFLFHAAPAVAILLALFVYLFWVAFAEEIRAYTNENHELLEQRDKNKVFVEFGQNIAGVVHNLKSTLMSVDGCIGIMEIASPEERKELLTIQKNSTLKMLGMINNFGTAVRSYQRTDREAVHLNRLVESSIEVLRGNRTLKHKLKIIVELGPGDVVFGVPMELMQVIDNIVTNAAEAMIETERYELRIETATVEDRVRFRVVDEGVGMSICTDCAIRNCLTCGHFDYGKSTKPEGVGIGMMYVRQIVKEMGGELHIDSEVDVGTTIAIDFPACRDNPIDPV